jgi:hypothetical protein
LRKLTPLTVRISVSKELILLRALIRQQNSFEVGPPTVSKMNGAVMVAVSGLHTAPVSGVGVMVGVGIGAVGVLVRVAVCAILVGVRVRVGVGKAAETLVMPLAIIKMPNTSTTGKNINILFFIFFRLLWLID